MNEERRQLRLELKSLQAVAEELSGHELSVDIKKIIESLSGAAEDVLTEPEGKAVAHMTLLEYRSVIQNLSEDVFNSAPDSDKEKWFDSEPPVESGPITERSPVSDTLPEPEEKLPKDTSLPPYTDSFILPPADNDV